MQEALEIAYDDDIDAIFIEPPDSNILTDEDSGDEDGGGTIDNLSGPQLRAQAEVKLVSNARVTESQPLPSSSTKKENVKKTYDWIPGDLDGKFSRKFPAPDYSQYKELSPVELFEKFFDDDMISFLIQETSRYALFKNFPDPKATVNEMKCFLAVLIVSGYSVLPGKRFYWESVGDMRNSMVAGAMRRDRFFQIMRFIHCADNTKPDESDKMWKLRPFMDKLKCKFLEHYQPEEKMSYDESMIKYYGRHSCKQFLRGKPIRFGYKVWSLNTNSGYLVNCEVYQGKNSRRPENYEREFGKAAAPLVAMLDDLVVIDKNRPYDLYFDNLFTSFDLLVHLKNRGYRGTGTIRENRISKNCTLTEKKQLQKKERGEYEGVIEKETGVMLVRWLDNSVVTVASTVYGISPITHVKRYSQAQRKIISVPMPHVISQYNANMGGTDLMDENLGRYEISIRSKKFWWPIFIWYIDVAINNAWQLHKKFDGKMPQLQFRREIAQHYLRSFGIPAKPGGRPSTSKSSISLNRISDMIRYDQLNHLVDEVPDKKRRRCAGEGCCSSIRTMCKKCDVGLCIPCFAIFHTK